MTAPHRYLTVGDVPGHYASRHDAAAVVLDGPGGTRSWAELDAAANRVANALADAGVRPGDRVATLLGNCVEYVEVMYGVARAGCTIVPLSSRSAGPEIERSLRFAEARALVAGAEFAATLEPVLPALPGLVEQRLLTVGSEAPLGVSYRDAIAAASDAAPSVAVDEDAVYWMPFTSGTTGTPKAALVPHRALVEQWRVVMAEFELSRRDTMLVAGPFYHSLGFAFGLAALFAGGRLLIHGGFAAADVLDAIERERVTVAPMVPTMYTMVLAEAAARDRAPDLSSMRAVISAGSPLLTATKEELLRLFDGAGLYEFYGSTELGVATVLRPEDQLRKVRSVGLPAVGTRIRLLDEDGRDVVPGEPGEVHKAGALLGPAYHANPEATAATDRDGWIASGDVGVLDDEGYLYIVDRKKDMVVTGGANVFPAEIEEVVAGDPAVLEVAVIGVPDPVWGEAVTAVVVPRDGAEIDPQRIIARCARELADHKKPRRVEVVAELPKSGAGKVLKRELRARFWSAEDANVR